MSDSFEKWAADKTFLLKASEGDGYINFKEMAREVWQAAMTLQSGEPVAVADRGVLNWIDGKQFNREADLYTTPQPVVPEWIEGAPELGMYAILHVPCKGYPNFCVIGYVEDDGSVYDMCGDELGVCEDDIERWAKLPALLSAGKGGEE
jgi:hypothetical protein